MTTLEHATWWVILAAMLTSLIAGGALIAESTVTSARLTPTLRGLLVVTWVGLVLAAAGMLTIVAVR